MTGVSRQPGAAGETLTELEQAAAADTGSKDGFGAGAVPLAEEQAANKSPVASSTTSEDVLLVRWVRRSAIGAGVASFRARFCRAPFIRQAETGELDNPRKRLLAADEDRAASKPTAADRPAFGSSFSFPIEWPVKAYRRRIFQNRRYR